MKKILVVLLSFCLALSLMAGIAYAAEKGAITAPSITTSIDGDGNVTLKTSDEIQYNSAYVYVKIGNSSTYIGLEWDADLKAYVSSESYQGNALDGEVTSAYLYNSSYSETDNKDISRSFNYGKGDVLTSASEYESVTTYSEDGNSYTRKYNNKNDNYNNDGVLTYSYVEEGTESAKYVEKESYSSWITDAREGTTTYQYFNSKTGEQTSREISQTTYAYNSNGDEISRKTTSTRDNYQDGSQTVSISENEYIWEDVEYTYRDETRTASIRKAETYKETSKTTKGDVITSEANNTQEYTYNPYPYTDDDGNITGYSRWGKQASHRESSSSKNYSTDGLLTYEYTSEYSYLYDEDGYTTKEYISSSESKNYNSNGDLYYTSGSTVNRNETGEKRTSYNKDYSNGVMTYSYTDENEKTEGIRKGKATREWYDSETQALTSDSVEEYIRTENEAGYTVSDQTTTTENNYRSNTKTVSVTDEETAWVKKDYTDYSGYENYSWIKGQETRTYTSKTTKGDVVIRENEETNETTYEPKAVMYGDGISGYTYTVKEETAEENDKQYSDEGTLIYNQSASSNRTDDKKTQKTETSYYNSETGNLTEQNIEDETWTYNSEGQTTSHTATSVITDKQAGTVTNRKNEDSYTYQEATYQNYNDEQVTKSVRKATTNKTTDKTTKNGVVTHEKTETEVTNYALRPWLDDEGNVTGYDEYGRTLSRTSDRSDKYYTDDGELNYSTVSKSESTYDEDGNEKTYKSSSTQTNADDGTVYTNTTDRALTYKETKYKDSYGNERTYTGWDKQNETTTYKQTRNGLTTYENETISETVYEAKANLNKDGSVNYYNSLPTTQSRTYTYKDYDENGDLYYESVSKEDSVWGTAEIKNSSGYTYYDSVKLSGTTEQETKNYSNKVITSENKEKRETTYETKSSTRPDGSINYTTYLTKEEKSEGIRKEYRKGELYATTTSKSNREYDIYSYQNDNGYTYWSNREKNVDSESETVNVKGDLIASGKSKTENKYTDDGRTVTSSSENKKYENKILYSESSSESERVYDNDSYWNAVSSKSTDTNISYHRLTGNKLSERVTKSETKNGEKENTTSSTTTNTVWRDNNLAQKTTSTSTSVYNKEDNSKSSGTSKSTEAYYNSYSGKLIYTKTTDNSWTGSQYESSADEYTKKYEVKDADGKVTESGEQTKSLKSATDEKTGIVTKEEIRTEKASYADQDDYSMTHTEVRKYKENAYSAFNTTVTEEQYYGKKLIYSLKEESASSQFDANTQKWSDEVSSYTEKAWDRLTGEVTKDNSWSSRTVYGLSEAGNRVQKSYSYTEANTSFDSRTGKPISYSAYSNDRQYNDEGYTTVQKTSSESKSYNSETGKQTSGSSYESARKYLYVEAENRNVTAEYTYTNKSFGADGKLISSNIQKTEYAYADGTSNEEKRTVTTDSEEYDDATFEKVSSTHTVRETDSKNQISTYESQTYNGKGRLTSTESRKENNQLVYDKETEDESKSATSTATSSSAKYAGEADNEKPISKTDSTMVYTYEKQEDGSWTNTKMSNESTTENQYGKSVSSENTVYTYLNDEEAGQTGIKAVAESTTVNYSKDGKVRNTVTARWEDSDITVTKETETETETKNTVTSVYSSKDSETGYTSSRESTRVRTTKEASDAATVTEEETITNKSDATNRTTVTKSNSTENWKNGVQTEVINNSETTVNGVKTSSSSTTWKAEDTLASQTEPKEGAVAKVGWTEETATSSVQDGDRKTVNSYEEEYTWTKDTADGEGYWKQTSTKETVADYEDGKLISSRETVNTDKITYDTGDEKTAKTRTVESIEEITTVDEEGEKIVTRNTSFSTQEKERDWQQTAYGSKTNVNGVETYYSENTNKTETSKDNLTTTTINTSKSERHDADTGNLTYNDLYRDTTVRTQDGDSYTITQTFEQGYSNYNAISGQKTSDYSSTGKLVSGAVDFGDAGVYEKTTESDSVYSSESFRKGVKTAESSDTNKTSYDYAAGTQKITSESESKSYNSLTGKLTYDSKTTSEENKVKYADDHANNSNYNFTWVTTDTSTVTSVKRYSKDGLTEAEDRTETSVWKEKVRTDSVVYTDVTYNGKTGEVTGRTEQNSVLNYEKSKYSHNWLEADGTDTLKMFDNDGTLTYQSTVKTANAYTDEDRTRTVTTSREEYDRETGKLVVTDEKETNDSYSREIRAYQNGPSSDGESFDYSSGESASEMTAYNKNGTLIYKSSSTQELKKDEETGSSWYESSQKQESYDAEGKLSSGYSYTSGRYNNHSENYNAYGLTYESDYVGNPETNDYTNTSKNYSFHNGKNVLTSEYVSKSEYVEKTHPEVDLNEITYEDSDGNQVTYTYNYLEHSVSTYYDVYGGITSIQTYDETYDEVTDEKTGTKTSVYYVGKDVQRDKTVTEKTLMKHENSGDYIESTTVYDWENKIKSQTIRERITEGDQSTYRYGEYKGDGEDRTIAYEYVSVNGKDENGRSYTEETTISNDKVTRSYKWGYDADKKVYVSTNLSNDTDGSLLGKSVSWTTYDEKGNQVYRTEYTDKDGKPVYSRVRTTDVTGKETVSYLDADNKEIGYAKTDDKGNYSSKTPEMENYELTGGWTEYKHDKDYEYEERKVYNNDAHLVSSSLYQNEVTTETYYENPGDILSYQAVTPENKTNDDDRLLESAKTETWYDLNGKQDHKVVTKTTYEWDEYPNEGALQTKTVTEYRNSADKAVVTMTVVNDRDDSDKSYTTWIDANGKEIGYERRSEQGDVVEQLIPTFNAYTGYVEAQEKTVVRKDKDGSETKTTASYADGKLTSESTRKADSLGGYTETRKIYNNHDNTLSYTDETTYDSAALKKVRTETNYRDSGAVGSTVKSETVYDAATDQWKTVESHYSNDGALQFVVEGTRETIAVGGNVDSYGTVTVENKVWKSASGADLGYYSKTDAQGNTESVTPDIYSYNGKMTGGWSVYAYDAATRTSTRTSFDENGKKTYESVSGQTSSSTVNYWSGTDIPSSRVTSSTDNTGMTTQVRTEYNEDGTQRSAVRTVSGRKSGTWKNTRTESHYDNTGALVYTYERVQDLQKQETTVVYKDAKGKQIGEETTNADGSSKTRKPTIATRTGKITGFTESGNDKDGNSYYRNYNEKGELLYRRETVAEDENGNRVLKYYRGLSQQPYEVYTYYPETGENETAYYRNSGEKVSSSVSTYNGTAYSKIQSMTEYYNDKGELTYKSLRLKSWTGEDSYDLYTVYQDKNGKEIGRETVADNGDRYSKIPRTTYTNAVTGYDEQIETENSTTQRRYDADGNLLAEVTRNTNTTYEDGRNVTVNSLGNGIVTSVDTDYLDENGQLEKSYVTYYDNYTGAYTSTNRYYYGGDSDSVRQKHYDLNGNVTWYGESWTDNDYHYGQYYWVNGNLMEYSWYDQLGTDGSLSEKYNPDGTWSYWSYSDGKGNSSTWSYDSKGNVRYISETIAGANGTSVTNGTSYNADGSISGYNWGQVSTEDLYGIQATDTEIWSASALKYRLHSESAADFNGYVDTWTDTAGNVKTVKYNDDTEETTAEVALANAANGWNLAFGDEWYYFENGVLATGWRNLGGTWYYFNADGSMATGVVYDNGTAYTVDAGGAWVSGWTLDAYGNWSYSGEDGVAVTGWQLIGGAWYYFDDGWYVERGTYGNEYNWKINEYNIGTMVTGAYAIWDSNWRTKTVHFFTSDGAWDTSAGWKSDGIDYYYFNEDGSRAIGWQNIGGLWYYFAGSGVMRNGWIDSAGTWYYMNETGEMAADQWVQERYEDEWYYMDPNGLMVTGWQYIGGAWYYFDASGAMAADQWIDDGGTWYYMNSKGQISTGWQLINGFWYYFNDNGLLAVNQWLGGGDTWYYMDENGQMVTGQAVIDGVVNIFNENGVWQGYAE